MNNDYYSRKPCRNELVWKKAGDGVIIVYTNYHQLIGLAPLGREIFESCDGKTPISAITRYLKKKHPGIPGDRIENEIYRFLHFMQSVGALALDSDDF